MPQREQRSESVQSFTTPTHDSSVRGAASLGVDRAALARDEDAAWAAVIAARAAWDAALHRANADARGAYAVMLAPSLAAVAVRDGALAGGAAVAESAAVGRPAVPPGGGGGPVAAVAAVPALIPAALEVATWVWAGWDWANSAGIPDAIAEGRAAYDRAKEAGHSHAEALDLAADVAAARMFVTSGGALAERGAAAIAKQALKHVLLKRFSAPAKAAGQILDLYDKAQTATDAMDHSGLLPGGNRGTGGTTATDSRGGGTDDATGTGENPHLAAARAAVATARTALAAAEAAGAAGDCDAAWDAYQEVIAANQAALIAESGAKDALVAGRRCSEDAVCKAVSDAYAETRSALFAASRAWNACVDGGRDDEGTEGATPDVPELRLSRVTETEVVFEWSPVAGATHYRFHYHRPDGTTHQYDPVPASGATMGWRFFGLTPGTEHCFTLTALAGAAESAHSERVCATTDSEDGELGDDALHCFEIGPMRKEITSSGAACYRVDTTNRCDQVVGFTGWWKLNVVDGHQNITELVESAEAPGENSTFSECDRPWHGTVFSDVEFHLCGARFGQYFRCQPP